MNKAAWITADPHPSYSRLDRLDGLTDTYTPTTPRQQHERYRAMIEIQPPPVVKPPSWTPLMGDITIVASALGIVFIALIIAMNS